MNKSDSIKELAGALAQAQAELGNASKNAQNPHLKSKYADLAEVLNTVRPVLASHGIAFTQMPSYEAGIVSVETMLMHSSGEWLSSTISAPVTKQDAQGVGSATSYCRRYALAAICGIAQEDDDASGSIGASTKQAEPQVIEAINACTTLESLTELWGTIPAQSRSLYLKVFSNTKQKLLGAA